MNDISLTVAEKPEYGNERLLKYDGLLNTLRDVLYTILSDPREFEGFHAKLAELWLSRKCNSHCRYCYQGGSVKGETISLEEAHKIVDLLQKDGFFVVPILNEWLPEFWPYLSVLQKCGCRQVASNGIIIIEHHKEFFPLLKDHNIIDIRQTIFPEKYHEFYTGRDRAITIESIKLCKAHGFNVVANFLVTKDTLPHVREVVEEVKELEVGEIYFQNYINTNRATDLQHLILNPEELIDFWNIYNSLCKEHKDHPLVFNIQANLGVNPKGDSIFKKASKYCNFCLAGRWEHLDLLYISPEKDIYPCALLMEPEFKIGKLIYENGNMVISYNDNKWEAKIKGYDRSNCGSLVHMNNLLHK